MYHSSERNSFVSKHVLSLFLFLPGVSPFAVSPGDARLAELQHYVQRETDALAVASDVAKQLEGIASLDHKAAAEVELDRGSISVGLQSRSSNFSLFNFKMAEISSVPMFSFTIQAT